MGNKKDNKEENKEKYSLVSKLFKKKLKPREEPVLYLGNDMKIEIVYVKPEEGLYKIGDKVKHDKPSTTWEIKDGFKRKNVKVFTEWGMYPLGSKEYIDELHGEEAQVQYDMVRAVQNAETVRQLQQQEKQKINPKVAILIVIALVVGAYFIMGA